MVSCPLVKMLMEGRVVFVDLLIGCEPTEGDGRPTGSGMLWTDHQDELDLKFQLQTFWLHLNPGWFVLLGSHC